jgi:NAD(P)-dependent dehydrogenase (short-subunit alcohol dehydrogenase family)
VNAIAPGLIDTPPNEIILHRDSELRKKFVSALCPRGRVGTADDVAQAAVFLASERSALVQKTGT